MGKIRDYAEALTAKLTDLFVIDTEDSSVHSTKSVSLETMGKTIAGTQTHSSLTTTSKTILGAINEVDGKTDNDISHYTGTPTAGTTAYEIAKSKEWIRVDEKQGSTAIDLPATWNELFVICRYGTSGGAQPQLTTGVLIPILAGRSLIIGGGSLFAQVDLNAQGTQIQMNYFEINSTNYTSTSYFTVYYR